MIASDLATGKINHNSKQCLENQTNASPLLTSLPACGNGDNDKISGCRTTHRLSYLDTLKRGALIRFVKESHNDDTGDVTKGDEESENKLESNCRC